MTDTDTLAEEIVNLAMSFENEIHERTAKGILSLDLAEMLQAALVNFQRTGAILIEILERHSE